MRFLKKAILYFLLYLVLPILFLAGLEFFLRCEGLGNDLSPWLENETSKGAVYTKNLLFYQQFFDSPIDPGETEPFITAIPLMKPPNTIRIFIFGESSALGWPDSRYSFGKFLQAMLNQMFPEKRWEVFNLCFAGVNSNVLRYVAEKSIFLKPDLVILYMGNNEVHGPFGIYHLFRNTIPQPYWLVQLKISLQNLYLVQNLKKITFTVGRKNPEDFSVVRYDDPRISIIKRNYEMNLYSIVKNFVDAGIPVFIGTLASNIRDWIPMESWFRKDISEDEFSKWIAKFNEGVNSLLSGNFSSAKESFELALQIDNTPAIIHFLLGWCFIQEGNWIEARKHFIEAKEKDGFGFVRAKSFINDTIKKVIAKFEGSGKTFLVPIEEEISKFAYAYSPGEEIFVDSCHFNFYGAYLTACLYLNSIVANFVRSNYKEMATDHLTIPAFDEVGRLLFLPKIDNTSKKIFPSDFKGVSTIHYPENDIILDLWNNIKKIRNNLLDNYYKNTPISLYASVDRFSVLESLFESFDRLTRLSNDSVYRFVGLLKELGAFNEALKVAEKLNQDEACDINYLFLLIDIHLSINTQTHRILAKNLLEEIKDGKGYRDIYLYYLLKYLIQVGDWNEARRVSEMLSSLSNIHPSKKVFSECVNIYFNESKSLDQKVEELKKILINYEWSWDSFIFLYDRMQSTHQRELYKGLLLDITKNNANSPFPYIILSLIYRDEENYATAISMLRKAIDLYPELQITYYRLAKMLRFFAKKDLDIGNIDSAIAKLEESVKKFPYYLESWNELINICGTVLGDEEYAWIKLRELEEIKSKSVLSHLWEVLY